MTIGVVQSAGFNSLTPTISATGGPNHSLIVVVSTFEDTGTPSISGITIGGVALTSADGQEFGDISNAWGGSWIYYKSGVASGQTALVVTAPNVDPSAGSGAPGGGVDIIEVDCPIVLDKSNHNAGNGTSTTSGTTGTLTVAEEIAIAGVGGYLPSDTSGWTDVGTATRASAYKVVSSTASLNFLSSLTAGSEWASVIATFRRGASGSSAGAFMGLIV